MLRFWATGAGGADCEDPETLTSATALYESEADAEATWWAAPLAEGETFVKVNDTAARLVRVFASALPLGR